MRHNSKSGLPTVNTGYDGHPGKQPPWFHSHAVCSFHGILSTSRSTG